MSSTDTRQARRMTRRIERMIEDRYARRGQDVSAIAMALSLPRNVIANVIRRYGWRRPARAGIVAWGLA